MNLLDRYLQAVARSLGGTRRDDVVAELRANILSQIEDNERELGRSLTEPEQADILRQYGNPAIIAGRYSEHNLGFAFGKQIIGPELFPFYKTVLLINLFVTVVILAAVTPLIPKGIAGGFSWTRVLIPLSVQFGIVTFVFAMLDRNKGSLFDKWDPRRLPPLKADPSESPNAHSVFSFIALSVGTLWLALSPRWPYLLLGPGALYLHTIPVTLMPQWVAFYRVIVVLLCCQLALQFFRLFRWLRPKSVRIADLTLKCIGIAIGILLLAHAPNYVSSPSPEIADWVNRSFLACVIVTVGIQLWDIGKLLLSLLRNQHRALPAGQC